MENEALLLIVTGEDPNPFRAALKQTLPQLTVYTDGESFDPGSIAYALCWKPRSGLLGTLPNLRAIFSMAAGIDHILADPALPPSPPIVRMIHDQTREQMRDYVMHVVLHYFRRMDVAARQQAARQWRFLAIPSKADVKIGLLGLGEMGRAAAKGLVELGFSVQGWARSQKAIPGIDCFSGPDGLKAMLPGTNVLISLLPATQDTVGLLNKDIFDTLPPGAVFVNLGRGNHLVPQDLLASLDSGHLSGATLDVYAPEPMPEDDTLWSHPLVRITPHFASEPTAQMIAEAVVSNIRRLQHGLPAEPTGDRKRGY